jgi:diguanylate cyclase (GGDEF)-like protein/hemerythrin-like metal-binding protein
MQTPFATALPSSDPSLDGFWQNLPFPLLWFSTVSDAGQVNDQFSATFEPGQVKGPAIQKLRKSPDAGWQPVAVRRRDGIARDARGQALTVPGGVLVIIDDTPGSLPDDAYSRLEQRIAELEKFSSTDRLTGAWNRAHLERMVDVEISRASRLGQPVTLILLDIDHFKRVNDVHGHLAGDAVLREFAHRVCKRMRSTDSLFRWGGEEFVVLAPAVGYRGGAVLAEDLRRMIAADPFPQVGPVTASFGIAEYVGGESPDDWFKRTDEALSAAKRAGRNCVHIDRRGNSDTLADNAGVGVLSLTWLEAYESGNATIDAEHRQLFELGNRLISAATQPDAGAAWRPALASLLEHVTMHFRHEEEILAAHGYERLAEHQRAHASLLRRATELAPIAGNDDGALGRLVDFLASDVIAKHLFKADRAFFPLFKDTNDETSAAVSGAHQSPAPGRE